MFKAVQRGEGVPPPLGPSVRVRGPACNDDIQQTNFDKNRRSGIRINVPPCHVTRWEQEPPAAGSTSAAPYPWFVTKNTSMMFARKGRAGSRRKDPFRAYPTHYRLYVGPVLCVAWQ